MTNEPIPGVPGSENGVVIFKILRNAATLPDRGKVCIVGSQPRGDLVRRLRRPRHLRRGRAVRLRAGRHERRSSARPTAGAAGGSP